ncbi:MAG: Uma2 family endonuclease [Planctomycetaceae bacterium]|nr:Uma2 family endonuclease [Planctomycetaceae bacterium]
MTALIADSDLQRQVIAHRRANGSDRWDEVWDGVYVLMPLPNDELQGLVNRFCTILDLVIGLPGLGLVRPGVNISNRDDDWTANYRCPDVVVFTNGTAAENRETHWLGGPDFAIEVVSPDDQTWDKLPFYESVGTRELLIVDREPWSLELYRLQDGRLQSVGTSTVAAPAELASEIIPLSFRLQPSEPRPAIEIRHRDGQPVWTA